MGYLVPPTIRVRNRTHWWQLWKPKYREVDTLALFKEPAFRNPDYF